MAFTINDDGGIDTFDFSTVSDDQNLDLNEDAISDVAGLTGNLIIGRGTVIENGMTGAGDDRLTGNDVDNVLSSGAGEDTRSGQWRERRHVGWRGSRYHGWWHGR